jgi:hypothetical protein
VREATEALARRALRAVESLADLTGKVSPRAGAAIRARADAVEREAEAPSNVPRRGAARDARSFEQKRRGGPVTGGAPAKAKGPRHGGGGKRRGRSRRVEESEAIILPIEDYDELSVAEIRERLEGLAPGEVLRLRDYEVENKHRKSVVTAMDERLAA